MVFRRHIMNSIYSLLKIFSESLVQMIELEKSCSCIPLLRYLVRSYCLPNKSSNGLPCWDDLKEVHRTLLQSYLRQNLQYQGSLETQNRTNRKVYEIINFQEKTSVTDYGSLTILTPLTVMVVLYLKYPLVTGDGNGRVVSSLFDEKFTILPCTTL